MHKILDHPHDKNIRDAAKAVGIELTSKRKPYEGCSTAKAHRYAVPKHTDPAMLQPEVVE